MLTRTSVVLFLAFGVMAQSPAAKPFVPFDVTGRVVTWDGQPVAGARIAIGDGKNPTTADLLRSDGPSTAADGSFTLACPAPEKGQQDRVLLVAGKGFASRHVPLPGPGTPVAPAKPFALGDLVLVPGQRMVGRVRDAAGQPVAGALVTAGDLLPALLHNGGENFVCTVRTSASGIFDLPCALPSGSVVEVVADGLFTVRRQPVAAGSPLEFELQPSGWIEGRVVTDGEQGLADAWLVVIYEADQFLQPLRTDATGAFRAPLRHPGRWRIRAGADGEQTRVGWSKVGEGASTAVVVAVPAKEEATAPKKLAVRANTKGSGAVVRTFRAVAAWGDMLTNGKPWLRQVLSNQVRTTKPSPDGTVEVDAPADEGIAGAVYVTAEGHAPLLQMDATWSEQSPTLTVELEPEASVRGVVRDQATGKPIAGALVTLQMQGEGWWGYMPGQQAADADVPRTAADGTFRVGQLGEGEWQLLVAVEGRPPARPQTVTLKNAQALDGLVVDVPVGAHVGGKLTGGVFVPGSRVSLQPAPGGSSQMMFAQPFVFADVSSSAPVEGPAGSKPLAADGSFAFEGLALGHYTLMLHLPAPPRSGGALVLPIDSFRVRAAGVQRDFDSTGDAAYTIRGRLTLPGATVPFENLIVVAEPVFDGGGWMHSGWNDLAQGLRTFVQRDGAWSLPAVAGSYRITVVDLQLGITVAVSKPVEVREADVVCDLEVPLTKVAVELKPGSGASMAFVDRIEVRGVLTSQREAGNTPDLDDSYDFGRGVQVPRGATSLTLVLPHGDMCLLARSNAAGLRAENEGQSPALGKLELPVPGDKKASVVFEIGPPPEISEEVPAAGGKGR